MRWVHRWLGLALGLPLVAVCLSGIAISYWHEIDRWHYGYPAPDPHGRALDLDALAARARQGCADCGALVEITPTQAAAATSFYFRPGPTGRDVVVVANADGRVLSARRDADDVVSVLYHLHSALFLGLTGQIIVGCFGFILALLSASGLWLWWPKPGRWSQALALTIPPPKAERFMQQLHNWAGLLASLVLLAAGATGVAIAFPDQVRALIGTRTPAVPTISPGASTDLSPSRLVRLGSLRFPQAVWTDLVLGADHNQPAVLTLKEPGEASRYGDTKVWLDRQRSTIVAAFDARRSGDLDRAVLYLKPLHSGFAFGPAGQLAFGIGAGLALLLFVTGTAAWVVRFQRLRSRAYDARAERP